MSQNPTKPSIFYLAEREWVQVRAALVFWRQVMKTSRTHPSRIAAVEPLFKQYPPLTARELNAMIEGLPPALYIGIVEIANIAGWPVATARHRGYKYGLKPALVHGTLKLYRVDDAMKFIEHYDA